MSGPWSELAGRIVAGLGVGPSELVQVRDRAGRPEVFQEVLLAVEAAGATPLPEWIPPGYVRRMLLAAPTRHLAGWDRKRQARMRQTDRILVLEGAELDEEGVPVEKLRAWREATHRLTATEEKIGPLPFLLAAIPTEERARQLGLNLPELENRLLPALLAGPEELRGQISRVLGATAGGRRLTIRSGANGRHELALALGDRRWVSDDGLIDEQDRAVGGVVSNLPAGSAYTTAVEEETEGELFVPAAGPAKDVLIHFERGRAAGISASSGADALDAMFDAHSGEPRRIGHVGLGLNPYIRKPLGWTLVDENRLGHVFVAFGENRYMGGRNASSLNVDFVLAGATLEVDGTTIVEAGRIFPGLRSSPADA